MSRRVRILGPEGRPERVDVPQPAAESLDLELAADGQECRLAEEVLREVRLAVSLRGCLRVEGADPEQGPGPLTVAGRDDRGVDVQEPTLLEEVVDGFGP